MSTFLRAHHILTAESGLYYITHDVDVADSEGFENLSFGSYRFASLNSRSTNESTLHVISAMPGNQLAERYLKLPAEDRAHLLEKFGNQLIPAETLRKELDLSRATNSQKSDESFRDLFIRQERTPSGIKIIGSVEGYSPDLLKTARELRERFPNHPLAREVLIDALLYLDNEDEAKLEANYYLADFPSDPQAFRSLWKTSKNTKDLEKSILIDPKNSEGFRLSAMHSVSTGNPISNAARHNISLLPQEERNQIFDDLAYIILVKKLGTGITENDVNTLNIVDPKSLNMLTMLPEYPGLLKSLFERLEIQTTNQLEDIVSLYGKRICTLLFKLGRFKVAERIAQTSSEFEVRAEPYLIYRDYAKVQHIIANSGHLPNSKRENLIHGMSAIFTENYNSLEETIKKLSENHQSESYFLRSLERFWKGQPESAVKYQLLYVLNSNYESYNLGTNFVNSYQWGKWWARLHDLLKKGDEIEKKEITFHASKILTGGERPPPLTRWLLPDLPRSMGWRVYAQSLLFVRLLNEYDKKNETWKGGFQNVPGDYIRLPNGFGPIWKEKVADFVPYYGGLNVEEVESRLLNQFPKVVLDELGYGELIAEDQVRASIDFHNSLALFWNYGALDESLHLVESALNKDSNSFDAWRMKWIIAQLLGRIEAEEIAKTELVNRFPILCGMDETGNINFHPAIRFFDF